LCLCFSPVLSTHRSGLLVIPAYPSLLVQ
jgi:hypothetical protein